ncbi:MAG TPA: hypothetical protein VLH38_01375 [Patescibacteria group bacterium]|nr:hypothetical protein [Patescibacteria group bacterium]
MPRLPVPGSDNNTWGAVLNEYLSQALDSSGNLKAGSVGPAQIVDGTIPQAKIQNLSTDLAGKLSSAARGAANGVASLDSGTQVPVLQLPTGVGASQVALGNHNHAITNLSDYDNTTPPTNAQVITWSASAVKFKATDLPAAPAPVVLTDAATIATDASLGTHFRVTLGGNRTLANPTNPSDGQKVMWEFIQDATGTRVITLGSAFAIGTDISSVTLTTIGGKRDFMGAIYNSISSKWYVIAFIKGY